MVCALGYGWDKQQTDRQDSLYLMHVVFDTFDFIGKIFGTGDKKSTGGGKLMDLDELREFKENFKGVGGI